MSKSANKMSVLQLTILTAVNMMGSGIIMLPSKLAQVGALSIVSWLVTAVGSMALAYVFAKCGMYSKKGGGMGGYAEYSFGKAGNFLANYTYGVSLIFANTAIAISAVGYALGFLGTTLDPVMTCAATVFTLWLATVLNFAAQNTPVRSLPSPSEASSSHVSAWRSSAGSGSRHPCTLQTGIFITWDSVKRLSTRSR